MTKPNPNFLLILPILNQPEKKYIKAVTVKRASSWISNCVYLLHWDFFCLCCCFLVPLNVRSFYLNETISKHFYTHVESGTYLFSDSYLLPVNISQPQDLPDESRVCSALLFRSLIKNWIKCEGQSLSANCNGCVWREFSKGSLFSLAQALEHPHKSRKIISSTWTKNPKMGKCLVERLSEMLLLPQSSQCWVPSPKPASSFCLNTPLTAHAKSWAASPSICNLSSPRSTALGTRLSCPTCKSWTSPLGLQRCHDKPLHWGQGSFHRAKSHFTVLLTLYNQK